MNSTPLSPYKIWLAAIYNLNYSLFFCSSLLNINIIFQETTNQHQKRDYREWIKGVSKRVGEIRFTPRATCGHEVHNQTAPL